MGIGWALDGHFAGVWSGGAVGGAGGHWISVGSALGGCREDPARVLGDRMGWAGVLGVGCWLGVVFCPGGCWVSVRWVLVGWVMGASWVRRAVVGRCWLAYWVGTGCVLAGGGFALVLGGGMGDVAV